MFPTHCSFLQIRPRVPNYIPSALEENSNAGVLLRSKSVTHVYIQRVTVHNTKPIPVSFTKIVDQIPVLGDLVINVKLLSPGFELPTGGVGSSEGSTNSTGHGTVPRELRR